MIRHYKAYLVYYMFSSHLYYFDYFVWTDTTLKRSKVTSATKAYDLWPFSMNAVEYGHKINMYGMNMFGRMFQLWNEVLHDSLSWLLTILKRFSDTAFSNRKYGPLHPMLSSETDHIYSRADCEKSKDRIYSTPVSNKIPLISASFKLWYLIIALLVLEIFKENIRQS